MNIMELELAMWDAAKDRNATAFLEVVDETAVMVCGGFRCSGYEYAQIIKEFDVSQYQILNFEIIVIKMPKIRVTHKPINFWG